MQMTTMSKPVRAAVLVRISDDRAGDAAGVARQEEDARALAGRMGWGVGVVVAENDVSAYKRRKVTLPDGTRDLRVVRPAFRRLLTLLEIGEADGLIAYDLDRVARDPRDLEDLIDAVERRRVPVESVSGSLRLSSDADVTMARVMVAVANKSSRDMSRRITRKMRAIAEEGRPNGGPRKFGFEPDGVTHREDEAVAIRWAARRLTSGARMRDVLSGLDARVPPIRRGQHWDYSSVVGILRNPRVAGLRTYHGEVVGPAVWKPILTHGKWEALLAALDARPRAFRRQVVRHWLTGVLVCGRCGRRLTSGMPRRDGAARYICPGAERGGCRRIAILAAPAEAVIEPRVLAELSRLDRTPTSRPAAGDIVSRERGQWADQTQLRDLARLWAHRNITFAEYTAARRVIEGRIEHSRVDLTAARAELALRLVGPGDPMTAWRALDGNGKRDVTLALLGQWVVKPADPSRPRGRFQADRLGPLREDA
jgi:site-specific DNA recombinase